MDILPSFKHVRLSHGKNQMLAHVGSVCSKLHLSLDLFPPMRHLTRTNSDERKEYLHTPEKTQLIHCYTEVVTISFMKRLHCIRKLFQSSFVGFDFIKYETWSFEYHFVNASILYKTYL